MAIDEKEFQRVADELAIRKLVARTADCVVRNDAQGWGSGWIDDCKWNVGGLYNANSREEAIGIWQNLVDNFTMIVQLPQDGVIEVQGDRGTGRWTVIEVGQHKETGGTYTLGLYQDDYVRVDGEWKFESRRFNLLYMGSPDLSGFWVPLPEDAR